MIENKKARTIFIIYLLLTTGLIALHVTNRNRAGTAIEIDVGLPLQFELQIVVNDDFYFWLGGEFTITEDQWISQV